MSQEKIELLVQFFSEEAITFDHKIVYPQIEDPHEDPFDRENINISKKLWEELSFQKITIPEEDIITNKEVCQCIYQKLQHYFRQQQKQNNQNQDHNQNLENNSLNKQIANIIYLKFIDDAKEIIHLSQSVDTSNIQISGCNQPQQINQKNVPTQELQIDESNDQEEPKSD